MDDKLFTQDGFNRLVFESGLHADTLKRNGVKVGMTVDAVSIARDVLAGRYEMELAQTARAVKALSGSDDV